MATAAVRKSAKKPGRRAVRLAKPASVIVFPNRKKRPPTFEESKKFAEEFHALVAETAKMNIPPFDAGELVHRMRYGDNDDGETQS